MLVLSASSVRLHDHPGQGKVRLAFHPLVCQPGSVSIALSAQDIDVSGVLLVIMRMRMVVMHVVLLTLGC